MVWGLLNLLPHFSWEVSYPIKGNFERKWRELVDHFSQELLHNLSQTWEVIKMSNEYIEWLLKDKSKVEYESIFNKTLLPRTDGSQIVAQNFKKKKVTSISPLSKDNIYVRKWWWVWPNQYILFRRIASIDQLKKKKHNNKNGVTLYNVWEGGAQPKPSVVVETFLGRYISAELWWRCLGSPGRAVVGSLICDGS